MSLLDSGDYESAYPMLEELGKNDVIESSKFDRAIASITSGDYDSAYALLEEIGRTDLIASNKYDRAMAFIDSGDYDSSYELLEEIGKFDEIASNKYDRAMAYINSGDYDAAYALLKDLQYKDSHEKAVGIFKQNQGKMFNSAEVGDSVWFGAYEQDNDLANGKEDIEWQVLSKENNRFLLISKYILDRQVYHTVPSSVTWESCALRTWLNETFLYNSFNSIEQAVIAQTTVTADRNPEYDEDPGNATTDRVFLLSIAEANKYFSSDSARLCTPTAFAVANGVYERPPTGSSAWWLRSPGNEQSFAADVTYWGKVGTMGILITEGIGIRPAMWIDLGKLGE